MSSPPKSAEPTLETPAAPKPSSPTSNVASATPAAPAAVAPASTDPKVLELVAMFPTIEIPVIELVLETSGGSVDRAIETLLGMTDPNFKPDELGNARVREEDSQLDLDAELARKLQLEDDQHAANQTRGQPQQRQYGYGDQQLPYQPRVSQRGFNTGQQVPSRQNSQPQQQQQQQGSELPAGMLLVEEKLGQFAEAGKRTFDSFFTKAKQKYSEYQAIGAGEGTGPSPVNTSWGMDSKQQAGPQQQRSYNASPQSAQGGLWGPSRSLSQRQDSVSSDSTSDSHLANPQPQTTAQAAPKRWQPSDTFEDDSSPVPRSYNFSNSPSRSPPPTEGTTPKGKIDMAKLGMLPKKRVDLLSTSPQAEARQPSAHTKIPATPPSKNKAVPDESDDDDDLEYTKNPFDER